MFPTATPAGASPRIGHLRVLHIAAPIVLSNATVPLLGLVNTGVVGRLGAAAPIGAVGIGVVILVSIYWIFGFLRMGTTGIVAQAYGRGDHAEVSAGLWRALIVAGVAGFGLVAVQGPLIAGAFRMAPAGPEVETLARSYLSIRIWGAPATIALYAVNGWLIAVERTRAMLLLQLWMNGLNIVLDIAFVQGLGLGVPGVAQATLIAEWSGLGFGIWLARGALIARRPDWGRILDRARLRRMALVNADIMLRSVLIQGCFTAFLFLGAAEGDTVLAANQVLLQFNEVAAYLLDGFAFAAETLVGQAVGAGSVAGLRRAAGLSARWAVGGSLLLGVGFALGGAAAIDVLTTVPEVRAAARLYLPWIAFVPIVSVAGFMLDGVFIGATLTREMRNVALLAAAAFGGTVFALQPLIGNHGLWAGLMAFYLMRGAGMAVFYPRAEARAHSVSV